MADRIRFRLNGALVEARGFPLSTTLLDFVRERGFTGSKEGCAEGECGACTVLMVRPDGPSRCRFVPVNSCLVPLAAANGHEIYTVEALARDGQLAEVQQAMIAHGGSQCGYCTPGFVVSMFAEQYRPGRQGHCDTRALSGNLCRCTGYRPIRDAALSLGPAPAGWFRDRMDRPAPVLEAFEYCGFYRPDSLADSIELLAAHPEARILSGGTDLIVESNLRDRRFPEFISVEGLKELREFHETENEIVIGAGLSLSEIGECWHNAPEVLNEWLELFASPLIRNRATMGGNLATASPIGDSAPLLLALDVSVMIAGRTGERAVPLNGFFRGYRETAMARDEILVSIRIPKPLPQAIRFYKVAKRRADDISTVAAGISVALDGAGHVTRARFAYGGVAAMPIRATEAESAVLGRAWDEATVRRAQDALARTLKPISDHRGSAEYRLAIAQSLLEKYLYQQQTEVAA